MCFFYCFSSPLQLWGEKTQRQPSCQENISIDSCSLDADWEQSFLLHFPKLEAFTQKSNWNPVILGTSLQTQFPLWLPGNVFLGVAVGFENREEIVFPLPKSAEDLLWPCPALRAHNPHFSEPGNTKWKPLTWNHWILHSHKRPLSKNRICKNCTFIECLQKYHI